MNYFLSILFRQFNFEYKTILNKNKSENRLLTFLLNFENDSELVKYCQNNNKFKDKLYLFLDKNWKNIFHKSSYYVILSKLILGKTDSNESISHSKINLKIKNELDLKFILFLQNVKIEKYKDICQILVIEYLFER